MIWRLSSPTRIAAEFQLSLKLYSAFRDREAASAPVAQRVTAYTNIVWETKAPDAPA